MRPICSFFAALFLFLATVTIQPARAFQTVDMNVLRQAGVTIPNLGVVSPLILRGGQPKGNGFEVLKAAGVKTIVNLRDGRNDIIREKAEAERLGLHYVSIPMSPFGIASQAQIEKFRSIYKDEAMLPMFVHCRQGKDRTGTMVAIYRLETSDWTTERTYSEMLSYGFHPIFVGLSRSVYTHAARLGRTNSDQPVRSSLLQDLLKQQLPPVLNSSQRQPG